MISRHGTRKKQNNGLALHSRSILRPAVAVAAVVAAFASIVVVVLITRHTSVNEAERMRILSVEIQTQDGRPVNTRMVPLGVPLTAFVRFYLPFDNTKKKNELRINFFTGEDQKVGTVLRQVVSSSEPQHEEARFVVGQSNGELYKIEATIRRADSPIEEQRERSISFTAVSGIALNRTNALAVGTNNTLAIPGYQLADWYFLQLGTEEPQDFVDVSVIDESRLWIAGNKGAVFYTATLGESWIDCSYSEVDEISSISGIRFQRYTLDSKTAYIAFERDGSWDIAKNVTAPVSDTGNLNRVDWQPVKLFQKIGIPSRRLNCLCTIGRHIIWAVGDNGLIVKSSDAGLSWTMQELGEYEDLRQVVAASQSTAWVVARDGALFGTQDGGCKWRQLHMRDGFRIRTLGVSDKSDLWASSDKSMFARSEDGGLTWEIVRSPYDEEINSMVAFDYTSLLAVGQQMAVISTVDGGKSWDKHDILPSYNEDTGQKWLLPNLNINLLMIDVAKPKPIILIDYNEDVVEQVYFESRLSPKNIDRAKTPSRYVACQVGNRHMY